MFRYSIILLSLAAGLFIYLVWRDISSPFYHWASLLGFNPQVDFLRDALTGITVPSWVVYSLPDGLWMFSFILLMMTIWDFDLNRHSIFWIAVAIAIGFLIEITQMYFYVLGRFDWMDMFFLSLGATLPILVFSKKIKYDLPLINHKLCIHEYEM